MTSGDTNTRDKGVIDAYRAASDALDEQPKAQSRAAILAAAARAVEAQPQDAATGATSRRLRPRERAHPVGPSRRPLALVASFLVAAVALVIATQTDEQLPPADQVASRVTEAPAALPAAQSPPSAAEPEAKREASVPPAAALAAKEDAADRVGERARAPERPEQQMKTPPARRQAPAPAASAPAKPEQEAPARNERAMTDSTATTKAGSGAQVGRIAPAEAPVVTALPPPPPRLSPAHQPPPPPVVARVAPPAGVAAPASPPAAAAEERSKENVDPLARFAARADPPASMETDGASAGKLAKARTAIAENTPELESDPVRWMERIVALREAGRDDVADRELMRLRQRYPDMKVPPNALQRTGTR